MQQLTHPETQQRRVGLTTHHDCLTALDYDGTSDQNGRGTWAG